MICRGYWPTVVLVCYIRPILRSAAVICMIIIVIIGDSAGITLSNALLMHLILLLFPHSMYLLLQELHLICVCVPDFIFFPLLILPTLLHSFLKNIEAT